VQWGVKKGKTMQVLIENYRDWNIYFDTEKEEFYTHSERWDSDKTKRSYASAKKFVDDFIKENEKFVPFDIEDLDRSPCSRETIKVVGIRKDGGWVIQKKDSQQERLSQYNEKNYSLYDAENESVWEEIKEVENRQEELRLQKIEVRKKFKAVPLNSMKETYKNLIG
jgi:hypothetical protein